MENDSALKIQKWYRGVIIRLKRLPTILYAIQTFLIQNNISFSSQTADGRVNSSIDEDKVIKLLATRFRIKCPNIRMWYDILVYDTYWGWLPVNIKITTTLTHDNAGNLAMCVYSYTNTALDLHRTKTYENGEMSVVLYNKLKAKEYNMRNKKDYYFIVLNKTNTADVIVNSIKGLSYLTPNINNLPFQICWNRNRKYIHKPITQSVDLFIQCMQKSSNGWKDTFMENMRTITQGGGASAAQ